jgi:hypothetical protein
MNRAERRRKAKELRGVSQGGIEMGQLQAPCGSTIMYVNDMTDVDPLDAKVIREMAMADRMKAIRKIAVTDHLRKGDCPVPEICANALAADAL